jgi:hypothetical protein
MAGFSGKRIYAKARSRKGAKLEKKETNMTENVINLDTKFIRDGICPSRRRVARRPTMAASCLSFAPSRLCAFAQKLEPNGFLLLVNPPIGIERQKFPGRVLRILRR